MTKILFILLVLPSLISSFVNAAPPPPPCKRPSTALPSTVADIIPPIVSLLAGCIGGSIGVGVAYPLDTIKVKMQTYNNNKIRSTSGKSKPDGALAVTRLVLQQEGLKGFYSGVTSTMAGQAIIKGVIFLVYDALKVIFPSTALGVGLAAALSGAAGGVVCTPIERLKVVLQAGRMDEFTSPLGCLRKIVEEDGWEGLFTRGLEATLAREIPAYFFYFGAYEFISSSCSSFIPPSILPLVGGAAAGVASWVPVYPVDVVKTQMQRGTGAGDGMSAVGVAKELYRKGGIYVFFDGLTPKLIRAVVNHSVTFFVFERICQVYFAVNYRVN